MNDVREARLARGGGALVAAGAAAFVGVFDALARAFDYPDVLDHPAAVVLPALDAGGPSLRALWALYACLPWAVFGGALLAERRLARGAPRLARLASLAAGLAAGSMSLGLLRWSTLHVALARAWVDAEPAARQAIAAVFAGANLYLGNALGELVGELCLAAWIAASAVALGRAGTSSPRTRRWLTRGVVAAAGSIAVGALRQLTSLVDPLAAANDVLLPVTLVVLGGAIAATAGGTGR